MQRDRTVGRSARFRPAALALFCVSLATGHLPNAGPAAPQESPRAWQQEEPYRPPDLRAFFPDDVAGGAALDALVAENRLRELPDAEYIAAVRRGLRRTTNHRTTLLGQLGNRFIWNVANQNPDAIELCYHAADFREAVQQYGTRHHAVYSGLSVVTEKSPAILRTLADLCVAVDDPNDLRRVAWGCATQVDQLLPYLDVHLASEDQYVRTKAENVAKIFRGELEAFEWAAERARQPPRPRSWTEMPDVRAALRDGDSAARLAVLRRIRSEKLTKQMNDSYLADFAAAADDPDEDVREAVAVVVGGAWIWGAGLHLISPEAVELLLLLSRDPDDKVRYKAVYFGLSTYRGEDDAVLRRMLDMAMDPAEAHSHDRLFWGLGKYGERAKGLLEGELRGDDPARARVAYALHRRLFEEAPAVVPPGIAQPIDLVGTWHLTVQNPPGNKGPARTALVVTRGEDGALSLGAEGSPSSTTKLLHDLLCTEVDGVLHFDFSMTIENTVMHTSGHLEGARLEGTSRIQGLDQLIVWSGERAPR